MSTIKISTAELKIIKEECKKIAKRYSGSSRFRIEIGERFNTDGISPILPEVTSINIWAISRDPSGDWDDTDLYTTVDFDELKKPLLMTADGRAIVDFYIYEWDGSFKCWGDLVTNAQAEFDMDGLKAMHDGRDKDKWVR